MEGSEKYLTYNMDFCWLVNKVDRAIKESNLGQTANVSELGSHDFRRLEEYVDDFEFALNHVKGDPEMDYPESHGTEVYDCGAPPVAPDRENDNANHMKRLFLKLRYSILNCQSSRLAAGVMKRDEDRFRLSIDKCRRMMRDYLANAARKELDYPESAPSKGSVAAGELGVDVKAA